jgi:hypothetical protein
VRTKLPPLPLSHSNCVYHARPREAWLYTFAYIREHPNCTFEQMRRDLGVSGGYGDWFWGVLNDLRINGFITHHDVPPEAGLHYPQTLWQMRFRVNVDLWIKHIAEVGSNIFEDADGRS